VKGCRVERTGVMCKGGIMDYLMSGFCGRDGNSEGKGRGRRGR
jgi:hypothetical protein